MKKTKNILLASIGLALLSCSNDDESVYDSVLSNTSWHQIYTDVPTTSTVDEEFIPPHEILDRLQSEIRAAQETDTINKSIVKTGEYWLSFGTDENCQLKDVQHIECTYQLATYEVKISHYPNQTYREDVGNGYTTEIVVKDDSLTLRQFYEDNIVRADTIYLGKNNEIKTYHMTYVRTGNRAEISGDKHLVGFINDDYSEIDFEEIGSFRRE